jgi:hypothetical protein
MTRNRNSKRTSKKGVEHRLGLYDRVAAHFASIAKSIAYAVVSLAVVITILGGWSSLPVPSVGLNLPFIGSAPAKSDVPERESAGRPSPLVGEIHIYIDLRRERDCSR